MREVVVLTGAAGGIGSRMAVRLMEVGYHVVGVDINGQSLAEGAELHDAFTPVVGDMADPQVSARIVERIDAVGTLKGVVNNAAMLTPTSLKTHDPQTVLQVCSDNLASAVYGCSLATRWWLDHGSPGSIVNIGSLQASRALAGWLSYSMAKAAIEALTRNIALEYGSLGIRANTLAPGTIRTPSYEAMLGGLEPAAARSQEARDVSHHPSGRLGTPGDVASAAVFLLSDESSFITGATIPIDGGWTSSAGDHLGPQ